jgi:TetR/AcrR family transcriptional regulator
MRRKTREEMRILVLAAARRLFGKRGYEGTSVQAIADEIGISKQALMHHFSSKASIRSALLTDCRQRAIEVLPAMIVALSSDGDAVDGVLDELISFFKETPDIARFLLCEILAPGPSELDDVSLAMVVAARKYLRQGIQAGTFRADIDIDLTVPMIGSVMLVTFATLDHPTPPGLTDLSFETWRSRKVREMVRIIRAALLPRLHDPHAA